MTRAPVLHLAIGLLIRSEMMEPVKPTTSEKMASAWMSRPFAVRKRLTPSRLSVAVRTSMTATLVARNSTMRFMRAESSENL